MMRFDEAQFAASRVYHDVNSLAQLKMKGKDNNPDAIREAAKQFESIFLGMMLKSMREANAAIIDDPLFDSSQMGMYTDMYDEQLTLNLSSSGIGLTDILVQQLAGKPATKNNIDKVRTQPLNIRRIANIHPPVISASTSAVIASSTKETKTPTVVEQQNSLTVTPLINGLAEQTQIQSTSAAQTDAANQVATKERGLDFSSPDAFVQSLWPYAQKAAKFLQLDPKLLIAQAALETGWGKFVMRTAQGVSSKNLFGIKASNNWEGERTQINTLEVESGVVKKKQAEFRTYKSYADSFNDYAQFISGKSRYQKAMNVASTPELYARELQTAGYATDPNYATKIGSIYHSPILNNALKMLVDMPR